MPRSRRRIENPNHIRFLTFSCYHRLPLFDDDSIKQVFVDRLTESRDRFGFSLHAWVIMPEHVHILIWPKLPDAPVPVILRSLKQSVAQRVTKGWKQENAPVLDRTTDSAGVVRFWQRGGGYDRNIYSRDELLEKLQYIHSNPVSRGLVCEPTEWAWSSARAYENRRDALLEIDPMRRPDAEHHASRLRE